MFTNANIRLFKQPDQTEREAIERKLGRPLTTGEILHGRLDRGQPGFHDQIPTTKLANADVHPLDAHLADAKGRLAEEEYRSLSPAARDVKMLEELRAGDKAKAAAALAHEQQQTLVRPLVEKLDQLLDANRFNPDFNLVEWETLITAREQLMLEGGCLEHAVGLCQGAFGIVQAKEDARKTAAQKKLEELVAMKQQIESELGITSAPTSSAPSPYEVANAEFKASMNAYRAAKAAGVTGKELSRFLDTAEAKSKACDALKPAAPAAPPPASTTPAADGAVTGGAA